MQIALQLQYDNTISLQIKKRLLITNYIQITEMTN